MKQIKILLWTLAFGGILASCSKQLDVKNPNSPTPASAATESGIIAYSQGVYVAGFNAGTALKYTGFFGSWGGDVIGYHEMMADVVGEEAANQYINQLSSPEYVILDDGTKIANPNAPNTQPATLHQINQNSYGANNTLYYEWAYMYNLNKAANRVLAIVDKVAFIGDAATKTNTIKAWCYWWKGFAYSRIGSIYYAGLIDNTDAGTNANYVTKEAIIAESNANYDKAIAALAAVTSAGDYTTIMTALIPNIFQVGKGGVLTPTMFTHNINTMKARNILVNTTTATMTASQWSAILALTANGINATDFIFTGRSNGSSDFMNSTSGSAVANAIGSTAGFRPSERWIQDFRPGDQRFANNFKLLKADSTAWTVQPDRGNAASTRYYLVDGGNGLSGVYVFGTKTVGAYEEILAGSYAENELMTAEAKIATGDVAGGLASVDKVRAYQGAGLAAVSGKITDAAAATAELHSERRVALAFRGTSFYDARRWGVITDISKGGGRTHAVVINPATGKTSYNATINYDYVDYWDVPDNELAYNIPAAGSAAVKNPKYPQ